MTYRENPYLQRTLKAEWEGYVAAVALQGAPAVQLQECRRAFYAGAYAMQSCMMDVSGAGVSEDDGVAYFEDRRQELITFYERVKAGTA